MAGVTGWWAEILPEPTQSLLVLEGGTPQVEVTHDVYVFPEPATLEMTGERPGVNGPPVLPEQAGLVLTGGAPSIGQRLATDDAELALVGGTPAIVQTANHLLAPAAATPALAGGTPTVLTGKILQPTAATPTLAGGTPSLAQRLAPTGATPTLTGGRPLINITYPPPTVQLTLTGGRPLLESRLMPPGGSMTLTGGTPIITNSVVPVAIGTVGTPGSENTGDLTCSITPTGGEDVLAFAWVSGGASSCYRGVYGGSSLLMKCLGRVKINSGQLAVFLLRNVPNGSATITISKTGSDWAQAVAVSYSGALDFRMVKIAKGSGTSASQSATPTASGRSIQSFTRGGISGTFGSLSGGTNRVNDSSGFVAGTLSDSGSSATFSSTVSSSVNWGSVVVDALTAAITTPRINNTGGLWTEVNGGTQTFTVTAAANDYIVVDIAQAGNGDPSSVTCDGTAMTLVDTQTWSHPNTSAGFIKRYRSAQIGTAGDKTVSITTTGSQWWRAAGCSISNVTSFGTVTKTSGTSSAPSQSVSCTTGQLILQSFVTSSAPTDMNVTNYFDSPAGSTLYLLQNLAEDTTTFSATGSTNWGAIATVIS